MVRYKSKYRNLKIPMKKSYKTVVNGQTVVHPGTKIEFEDSIFETDNQEIINFLDTDQTCVRMQKNNVFAKIDGEVLQNAQETLEEREEKEAKAKEKKAVKKPTAKEKGKKTKVGKKNEKPAY